ARGARPAACPRAGGVPASAGASPPSAAAPTGGRPSGLRVTGLVPTVKAGLALPAHSEQPSTSTRYCPAGTPSKRYSPSSPVFVTATTAPVALTRRTTRPLRSGSPSDRTSSRLQSPKTTPCTSANSNGSVLFGTPSPFWSLPNGSVLFWTPSTFWSLPSEVAGACSSPPPGAASVSRAPARTKSRGRKARSRTGTAPDRLENRAVPTAFTWPIKAPTTRLLTPDAEGALPCCGRKARSRAGGAPGRLGSWSPDTAFGWSVRPPTAGLSIPDARGGSCGATGTIGSLGLIGTVGPGEPPP